MQGTAEGAPFSRAEMRRAARARAARHRATASPRRRRALGPDDRAPRPRVGQRRQAARVPRACSRRSASTSSRRRSSASPRPTSRTRRSSRTRWPRRGTRARMRGLPALADDSGICVDALGRRAGRAERALCRRAAVRRAQQREAGRRARAASPTAARTTTACWCWCATPTIPSRCIAEGRWHGTIVDTPRGDGGFGYDPHFEDAATGLTGAELPLERKNELSHRGKAMRALIARLASRGIDALTRVATRRDRRRRRSRGRVSPRCRRCRCTCTSRGA